MTPAELETVLNTVFQNQSQINGLQIFGAIVSAIAVAVAYFQLRKISEQISQANEQISQANEQMQLARQSLKEDHERSRREKSIESLKYYQQGTKLEHNKFIQFLDRCSEENLIKLRDGIPITVSGPQKELACNILHGKFGDAYDRYCGANGKHTDDPCTLTHLETMHIRFLMLDIINHYEICLGSWHLGLSDEETTRSQFFSLVDKRDGKFKLQSARDIFGREKFPATEAFRASMFPETIAEQKPVLGHAHDA